MNSRHRFALAAVFVALASLVSAIAGPELPDQLVTNWDAAGEPNGTTSRTAALVFLPAVSAGVVLLLAVIPRIDPLRENVAAFRAHYDWFVVLLTAFLTFLHAGIVAFNLGYEFPFTSLVLVGVAGLFYYVGVLLGEAKRNWFVGIRTPWTLSSDEVWDRTHLLGAKLFKLTAVVTLLGAGIGESGIYVLLAALFLTAATTTAYSYYLYRKLERNEGPNVDVEL